MKNYQVTLVDGSQLTIQAAKFVIDGMGVRFFDENDNLVAAWSEFGVVKSVTPVNA